MTKATLLLGLLSFLLLASGCDKSNPNAPASVSGKVTYNGKSVGGGTIKFHSKEAGAPPIAIDPDGSYSATDLPVGDFTVSIETESVNKDKKQPQYGGGRGGQGMMSPVPEGAQAVTGEYVKIPAKYADPKTSGLTITLKKGKTKQDFELTD